MLFNSYEFIFLFLPVTLLGYFFLNRQRFFLPAQAWLVFASLFFYSWWKLDYLPIILSSILFNFSVGAVLSRTETRGRRHRKLTKRAIFYFGVTANVLLLGYFKYYDFFIGNINAATGIALPLLHLTLPLGISFFTFQQIKHLSESYKLKTREYDFLSYTLFVTYFPHLIAGPIVHYKDLTPQLQSLRTKIFQPRNLYLGLAMFIIGLFKKVMIADSIALWANRGFDQMSVLNFGEAWVTSLAYAFQLYFDFSGYTDMAIGAARMFNIEFPLNFNCPYLATSIQDFWRRWHITLSQFLRDHIYIPLGGNRRGEWATCRNLMLTFLIGGFWHGAGWTFIFWGFLHGLGLVAQRLFSRLAPIPAGIGMSARISLMVGWLATFIYVNFAWVFFRAKTWEDALKVCRGMLGLTGWGLPAHDFFTVSMLRRQFELDLDIPWLEVKAVDYALFGIVIAAFILLNVINTQALAARLRPHWAITVALVFLFLYSLVNLTRISEFIYFNF